MKTAKRISQFCFLLLSFNLQSQIMFLLSGDGNFRKLNYTFGDEFNSASLDRSKWDDSYGWARSIYCNKELQYYSPESNFRLDNGSMKIVAKNENVTARTVDWKDDTTGLYCGNSRIGDNKRTYNYTSAMLQSKEKFFYGYYEICFKAPYGSGFWPAFWLFGGHENDEIDVFELKGERNNEIHVDVHCPKGCDDFKYAMGLKKNWGTWLKCKQDLKEGFNVMGLLWEKGLLTWFLNGTAVASFSNYSFDYPLNLITNLAIADNNGPFKPGPNAKTPFPSELEIDYIRYYSLNNNETRTVPAKLIAGNSKLNATKTALKKKHKAMQGKVKPDVYVHFAVLPGEDNSLLLQKSGLLSFQLKVKITDANSKTIFDEALTTDEVKLDAKNVNYPLTVNVEYGKCILNETIVK